jgi:hypothetical protein
MAGFSCRPRAFNNQFVYETGTYPLPLKKLVKPKYQLRRRVTKLSVLFEAFFICSGDTKVANSTLSDDV